MSPKNTSSSSFLLSLTVEASEPHVARVTFRLTITRIADLITVKAKRQKKQHTPPPPSMLYNSTSRPTTIEYRVVNITKVWHRRWPSPSQCQECERNCVGDFIMLIFLATRFYSPVSLFHDLTTIFAVDRHYVVSGLAYIKEASGPTKPLMYDWSIFMSFCDVIRKLRY